MAEEVARLLFEVLLAFLECVATTLGGAWTNGSSSVHLSDWADLWFAVGVEDNGVAFIQSRKRHRYANVSLNTGHRRIRRQKKEINNSYKNICKYCHSG